MSESPESPSWYKAPIKKDITPDQINKISQSKNISELRETIDTTANENNRSPWEVTEKYRSSKEKRSKKYWESFTYITDLHGAEDDNEFYSKLESQLKNPPEFIICLGDTIGTKSFDKLQKLFYNSVTNVAKEKLNIDPNTSDSDLIDYHSKRTPEGYTLKQGFFDLKTFEFQLQGKTDEEIKNQLNNLSDTQIAENIKKYCKYIHYGHYASNLPDEVKSTLAIDLQKNFDKLMETLDKFQSQGTKIIFLEGNWDARPPIDFVPNTPDVIPLPPEKRIFNLEAVLKEHGIELKKTLSTLETETSLHVLAPFDALSKLENIDTELVEQITKQVNKAKQNKKAIILDAHGQPNWKIHRLFEIDPKATGENAKIMRSISYLSFYLEPDEIIYGHLHDPIKDSEGKLISNDPKYLLSATDENTLNFTEVDNNSSKKILSSYIEKGKLANLKISRFDKHRKISGLGGNRDSISIV